MTSAFYMIGNDTISEPNYPDSVSDNIMDQLSGNKNVDSGLGLNFEDLKAKKDALFSLSKKYKLLTVSEDGSISDFKDLNLKIKEISDLIKLGESDIDGYVKKTDSLLKNLKAKIDQAFQTKIKAILNGEEKSEEKNEEKLKPKKGKETYTNGGAYYNPSKISAVGGGDKPLPSKDVDSESKSVSVSGISVKDLELIKAYLEFKGEKSSSIYVLINSTLLKNIKQHPGLLSKAKYQDFIKIYIVESIIDNNFNIPNSEKYKKDFKKLKENTETELGKFREEIPNRSVEEDWSGSWGLEMDEARDNITSLEEMDLSALLENKKGFLGIDFKIPRPDLKQGLVSFKVNSADTNNNLSDLITDKNIDDLSEELGNAKTLFEELKRELSYIYNYLETKPNLTPDEKLSIENDIKSIVGLMYFINGLKYTDLNIENFSLITWIIRGAIDKGPYLGIPLIGITAWVIFYRTIIKIKNSKKLFNELDKNLSKENKGKYEGKKEGFDRVSVIKASLAHLNTSEKIKELINEMINEEGELKEEYKDVKDIFNRLKKLHKLKLILNNFDKFKDVKINNNSVFLNDKGFARDVLIEIFSTGKMGFTYKWGTKAIKAFTGTGIFGNIGDIINNGKYLGVGSNLELFGERGATKILDSFIEKYGEIASFSKKLQNIKNDISIDENKRKQVKKTVNDITERLINKNVLISEVLVESFNYSNDNEKDKLTKEIKEFLDSKPFVKEFRLAIKALESNHSYDGKIDKYTSRINIIWELLLEKFSRQVNGGEKAFRNIGKTEFTEMLKSVDNEFERINKKFKIDGKVNPEEIQKHMMGEFNSELKTNFEVSTVNDKAYQDRMKESGETKEIESIKELRETIRTENNKLGGFKFEDSIIDKIKTKADLENIKEIISKIESTIAIKDGLGLFTDIIDKIINENKENIEGNITNKLEFKIDSRLVEMLGEEGEISNIKKIFKYIDKFEGKEWFTNEFKDKLSEKIILGLETTEKDFNKIGAIFEQFKFIDEIKVENIYKFEGNKKVIDDKATEDKLQEKTNEILEEFKRVLELVTPETAEARTTESKTKETTDTKESTEKTENNAETKEFERLLKLKNELVLRMKLTAIIEGKLLSDVTSQFRGIYGEDLKNMVLSENGNYETIEEILSNDKNVEILERDKSASLKELSKLHASTRRSLITKLGKESKGAEFLNKLIKKVK